MNNRLGAAVKLGTRVDILWVFETNKPRPAVVARQMPAPTDRGSGDGIYLGVGQRGVPCTDILIRAVLCDRSHRQGISVISAENVLMENCVLRGTSGTPPMAEIDFEPNEPGERIANCVMRNCTVADNAGDGFALCLGPAGRREG
jgi:hypothetical protein